MDEPISLGVRRRHGDDIEGNSAELTPRRIKRLKTYARKVCQELSIDEKPVFDFVDVSLRLCSPFFTSSSHHSVQTGNLYLMLVDIKATLVKYEASNQTSQLQALQDTLNSKDFEVCALSTFQ